MNKIKSAYSNLEKTKKTDKSGLIDTSGRLILNQKMQI